MAIPQSQSNPNAYSVGLSVTIFFFQRYSEQKKGFPLLSLLQFIWISHGIEAANNSPITDKFNLGVIQV